MKRASALALIAAVLFTAPADAGFPGTPGPIAYSRTETLPNGRRDGQGKSSEGGIFARPQAVGTAARQLTAADDDEFPAYSPDGSLLAISGDRDVEQRGTRFHHIYVVRPTGAVSLTDFAPTHDYNPSFSPDGRWIVFDRAEIGAGAPADIWAVGVDGSSPIQLTSGPADDREPVFSGDGRRILFVSDRDRDARDVGSDIFAMRRNGGGIRLLVDGPLEERAPDVSPDGERIAYAGIDGNGAPRLFVAGANGGDVRAITPRGCSRRTWCLDAPAWSPDGRWIAALGSKPGRSAVVVIRADGGSARAIAAGKTSEAGLGTRFGPPAWGPKP